MNKKEFYSLIDEIPGGDGWWKNSTGEAYKKAGDTLVEKGFTYDEVIDLLSDLFDATSEEFGN